MSVLGPDSFRAGGTALRLRHFTALLIAGIGLPFLAAGSGCAKPQPRVVLYCAQDEDFAKQILATFTERTGLEVPPKFDTEASKSVQLYLELVQEKDRPRCDVFWNNEILSTIRLQRQDMLEPYDSPAGKPYPPECQPADDSHTWHAFAKRARVLVVNTRLVKEEDRPHSLLDLTDPRWKGKVAMSKPTAGTSATQAACLFEVLGADRAKAWYRDLRTNGIQIAPGNRDVARWVGEGRALVGITDTDDTLEEIGEGSPVAMLFPDADRTRNEKMGTLFIPNSVAIIRGGPNPDGARKLVDYLLSAEVEKRLAEGGSHQIPLNPEVKAELPKVMEPARSAKPMEVDFGKAADLWNEVQTFLSDEFDRP
jgi:iron(III) transport system substrate-binding protein